jgi:DNA-binding XRE family transcriptional regulator
LALTTTQRHTVKLTNAELFNQLRELHGYSIRGLTEAVDRKLNPMPRRSRSARITVSKSTIGHLSSGERTTCNVEVAKAIAGIFKLPPSALFTSKIDTVTRETKPTR